MNNCVILKNNEVIAEKLSMEEATKLLDSLKTLYSDGYLYQILEVETFIEPEKVKRYHKSFIGLMEENKEGEWVSITEVTKLQKRLGESYSAFEELSEITKNLNTDLENTEKIAIKWQNLYNKEIEFSNIQLLLIKKLIRSLRLAYFGLFTGLLYALFKLFLQVRGLL